MDPIVEIYVVTHKKFNVNLNLGYIPIQVGFGDSLGILRDNQGDNISEKNQNYCELTAAYWIWKNSKADIVGLEHYRRYFVHSSVIKKYTRYKSNDILSIEEIIERLSKYDFLVPTKLVLYNTTVEEHYEKYFKLKDYLNCREIISKFYPDYIKAFDTVSSSHSLYPYNMMITRKKLFDEYHQWLFDVLFNLETITDLSGYDGYQNRIYGFLSERLFNVWILNNSYSIGETSVINTENWKEYQPLKNTLRAIALKTQHKTI